MGERLQVLVRKWDANKEVTTDAWLYNKAGNLSCFEDRFYISAKVKHQKIFAPSGCLMLHSAYTENYFPKSNSSNSLIMELLDLLKKCIPSVQIPSVYKEPDRIELYNII